MAKIDWRLARTLLACLGLALLCTAPAAAQERAPGVWGTKAAMPMRRQETAVVALDGKIYVIGGNHSPDEKGNAASSTRTDEYDSRTNKWRSRAPIPHAVNHVWAAAVGGKIYAIGGFEEGGHKSATFGVYVYDPQTNKWRDRVSMPDPARGAMGLALLDGKIHVIGGYNGDQTLD